MPKKKHVHRWTYYGGEAKCACGKFVQPGGKITSTATGIKRKKKKAKR